MLKLIATLVGKSSHRDGGYDLTFNVKNSQLVVHVTEEQAEEFADTAKVIELGEKEAGIVETVHQQGVYQYPIVINGEDVTPIKQELASVKQELKNTKAELAEAKKPETKTVEPVKPPTT